MSYHTVDVDCIAGTLTSQNGQMALISNEAKKSLPIEDISSVIVNGFDITIHKQLIVKLGIAGKPLIICEKYKPVSILLPASRSTDTLLTQNLASLSIKMREALWKELINAKCQNQSSLCEHLLPKSDFTQRISKFAYSRLKNKESNCTKHPKVSEF